MKDYYDLYHLLSKEKYDSEILQEAIVHTFENRHTSYDADTMFFRNDYANNLQMQVRWQAFLRKITKKRGDVILGSCDTHTRHFTPLLGDSGT